MHESPPADLESIKLDLCKFDYEQTAQRYENIYKDIWQIFSYMAFLTGAILTFGASQLPPILVTIIAPFPLVFWYFAIFIPMDRYGRLAKDHLRAIENSINDEFLRNSIYQLDHYTQFASASTHKKSKDPQPDIKGPRVSDRVRLFVWIGVVGWIVFLAFTLFPNNLLEVKSKQTTVKLEPTVVQFQTQDLQLQKFSNELSGLSKKLDSIEKILHETTTNIPKPKNNNPKQ